jgi:hypothetical protein
MYQKSSALSIRSESRRDPKEKIAGTGPDRVCFSAYLYCATDLCNYLEKLIALLKVPYDITEIILFFSSALLLIGFHLFRYMGISGSLPKTESIKDILIFSKIIYLIDCF